MSAWRGAGAPFSLDGSWGFIRHHAVKATISGSTRSYQAVASLAREAYLQDQMSVKKRGSTGCPFLKINEDQNLDLLQALHQVWLGDFRAIV
jgi:hypothetical protein